MFITVFLAIGCSDTYGQKFTKAFGKKEGEERALGIAALGDLTILVASAALAGLSLAGVLSGMPPAATYSMVGVGAVTALVWIVLEAVTRNTKSKPWSHDPTMLEMAAEGVCTLFSKRTC